MSIRRWFPMGLTCLLACSGERPRSSGSLAGAATAEQPALPGDLPSSIDASAGPPVVSAVPVPSDFVQTELGGYKLGVELSRDIDMPNQAAVRSDPSACAVMLGVVRDFRGSEEPNGHPDFEIFDGKKPTTGLLAERLGVDNKPSYASRCENAPDKTQCPYGQMTTSRTRFDEWYRSVTGVNHSYLLYLAFAANGGVYTFASKSFFPVDDAGFGNTPGKKKRNFSFTTELHTTFRYRGGEQFGFTGDDDLWVFIHGRLALDLGGLHPPASAKVDLDAVADELGLVLGNSYTLELFHAERHSGNSNFRVDTTIEFTDCGRVTPELL